MSQLPSRTQPRYRDFLTVGLLIVGVGTLTFTPVLYVLFHAFQWPHAVTVLDRLFLPAFCLTAAAVGLAYQRMRARRMLLDEQEEEEEPQS